MIADLLFSCNFASCSVFNFLFVSQLEKYRVYFIAPLLSFRFCLPSSLVFFTLPPNCPLNTMGLFASFLDTFCEHCSTQSIYTLASVGALSFIALSIVINVLRQLLFKKAHEPPVVFHWFPFVGSTISYGMDPYTFFNQARAKVGQSQICSKQSLIWDHPIVRRHLHFRPPWQEDHCLPRHQG
jgi:hypothetical protein